MVPFSLVVFASSREDCKSLIPFIVLCHETKRSETFLGNQSF